MISFKLYDYRSYELLFVGSVTFTPPHSPELIFIRVVILIMHEIVATEIYYCLVSKYQTEK